MHLLNPLPISSAPIDLDIEIRGGNGLDTLEAIHLLPPCMAQDRLYAHDILSITELSLRCKQSRPISLGPYANAYREAGQPTSRVDFKIGLVCHGTTDIPKHQQILAHIESSQTGHLRRSMLWLALTRSDVTSPANRMQCAEQALKSLDSFQLEQKDLSPAHQRWLRITCEDIQELLKDLMSQDRAVSFPLDSVVVSLIARLGLRMQESQPITIPEQSERQVSPSVSEDGIFKFSPDKGTLDNYMSQDRTRWPK
ncbi:hypothetical protein WAI453_003852 [Rhynchosporium graminicola]|uniref:Uncharacterized protein n=1 Tax=Rhynchosporium graminicola TaxID=2792576 RepID=A0A1E1K379_9HELO|nr:uncharacterized protein RCO7_14193 [Rhynchosporium commune]